MERRGFIATLIALSFTCFASGDAVAGATVSGTIKRLAPGCPSDQAIVGTSGVVTIEIKEGTSAGERRESPSGQLQP